MTSHIVMNALDAGAICLFCVEFITSLLPP